MKLNPTFIKELQALNGTGLQDRFPVINNAHAAAKFIANNRTSEAMDNAINAASIRFGRATVGICVAATILLAESGRPRRSFVEWASAVMSVWVNHTDNHLKKIAIQNRLSFAAIDEYARYFIERTSA